MTLRSLAVACLAALAAPACSNVESSAPEETGVATSAVTTPTRIYASNADLDLSFETLGTFEERDGVRALILHATANRYLESVYSFVPDDIFGDTRIISERRLEVVLHEGYELNTVLSGLPLFVAVNTFTGTPNHYTARIVVAPRFYDFLGSGSIWVDTNVDPVYVVNGTDNLLYRGRADVAADALTVTATDGAPVVSRVDANTDTFHLDWRYAPLHQAIDPHTDYLSFAASLRDSTPVKKTARLVARVTELALTTGDAYEVWPTPDCQPDSYTCIHDQPAGATDFSACGSYRQVARCLYVTNACEVFPAAPLSLSSIDTSSLDGAVDAWNEGSNGGTWYNIASYSAYRTPACTTSPTTIQGIVAQLANADREFPDVTAGTYTDRAGLSQSTFFNQVYSDGASLLSAIDAFTGGGTVQAWLFSEPRSCNNCHLFGARAVLYYPQHNKVVMLTGSYGYDS